MRPPDDFLDPRLVAELRRAERAPDVTAGVMRRLGLTPVGPAGARRRRIARVARRAGLGCVALALAAIGVHVHLRATAAHRAAVPTLPSAIHHDLERHGATFDRAISSIRSLQGPWLLAPPSGPPAGAEPRPPARPTLGEPPL